MGLILPQHQAGPLALGQNALQPQAMSAGDPVDLAPQQPGEDGGAAGGQVGAEVLGHQGEGPGQDVGEDQVVGCVGFQGRAGPAVGAQEFHGGVKPVEPGVVAGGAD